MGSFMAAFVPLLVAVDAIGTLAMYVGLTEGMDAATRRRTAVKSAVTATIVALTFLAVGRALLGFLGVEVADLAVAGGVLLFVISLGDLLTGRKPQRTAEATATLSAVPIAVPLIAGRRCLRPL